MTESNLHAIYHAIGELKAEVTGLRRDIQQSEARSVDSLRRADQHRAAVHKRVDDLVVEVSDMKIDMATMQRDVTDTKSVTDEVKRWKLLGGGALFVTGLSASAIASLVTYFWSDLLRWLRGM